MTQPIKHDAYPMEWPVGCKRTDYRQPSKFKTTFTSARDFVFAELGRMGATDVTMSTNVALRRDGMPLANQAQPKDTGVAVYFIRKSKQMVFACDKFNKIEENLYAIGKTIEALRGIERWGTSDMMERSLAGFNALPASTAARPWTAVFGLPRNITIEAMEQRYKQLAREANQNFGQGAEVVLYELNQARDSARKELSR